MSTNLKKSGFSLIELAISLTIVALLIAAVAGGNVLIKQAKIKETIVDLNNMKTALNTFEQTYDAVAGDMYSANVMFPGCAGIPTNCSGNGNGFITANMGNAFDGVHTGDEPVKVSMHLHLSGIMEWPDAVLLPGNYDYLAAPGADHFAPLASVTDARFYVASVDPGNFNASTHATGAVLHNGTDLISNFDVDDTVIHIMKTATSVGTAGRGALDAESVFNIDVKIDNGIAQGANATGASTGKFRVINDLSAANACVSGDNYTLSQTATTCIPGYLAK